MRRSDISRILAIMAAIGLVVFAVVQIARLARDTGNEPVTTESAEQEEGPKVLSDYATDESAVVMTRIGIVNAQENHREIRITVTQRQRKVEIISGYNGRVIERETFPNTANAYQAFLQALEFKGFSNDKGTDLGDGLSVCSTGRQLVLELINDGQQLQRLWATSCNPEHGNFAGNGVLVRRLFERQIPDYRAITRGVSLN